MSILLLSNEIIEQICDCAPTAIVRHFIRTQLASTSRFYLKILGLGRKNWSVDERASIWLQFGYTIHWLIYKRICTKETVCNAAAIAGDIESLHITQKFGYGVTSEATVLAAASGHIHCLRYLLKNCRSCDYKVLEAAAINGHLDCLEYAFSCNRTWTYTSHISTFISVAKNGHLDCMRFLDHHFNPVILNWSYGITWSTDACAVAASNGHLDCLVFLHENNYQWDYTTCAEATAGGYIDCLRYAIENGCDCPENICTIAAIAGHVDCLRYLHQAGYEMPRFGKIESLVAAKANLACWDYIKAQRVPRILR